MYVNSGGEGAGACEGAAAEEEHCANDQPVSALLRSSLEPLMIEHQVGMVVMMIDGCLVGGGLGLWLMLVGDCFDWLLVLTLVYPARCGLGDGRKK